MPRGRHPPASRRWPTPIRNSDAVVLVTGEYNHSVPPALTNLLDHFLEEWSWRPSGILSYSAGSFGGVRAVEHLRSIVAELGMVAIPSSVPVPRVGSAFSRDGSAADERLQARFDRFAAELEWYAEAMAARRASGTPY